MPCKLLNVGINVKADNGLIVPHVNDAMFEILIKRLLRKNCISIQGTEKGEVTMDM
jgi:hypothetical protein